MRAAATCSASRRAAAGSPGRPRAACRTASGLTRARASSPAGVPSRRRSALQSGRLRYGSSPRPAPRSMHPQARPRQKTSVDTAPPRNTASAPRSRVGTSIAPSGVVARIQSAADPSGNAATENPAVCIDARLRRDGDEAVRRVETRRSKRRAHDHRDVEWPRQQVLCTGPQQIVGHPQRETRPARRLGHQQIRESGFDPRLPGNRSALACLDDAHHGGRGVQRKQLLQRVEETGTRS